METVVIFIETGKPPCYEALAAPDVCIEFMPFHAAASVGEHALDLAVIDCGNDFESGLRTLQKMKQYRTDVPVIFIAEASSEAVVLEAFKLGARDYFRKPFDPFEFGGSAARILGFKRNQAVKSPEQPVSGKNEIQPLFTLPDKLPEKVLRAITFINENLLTPLRLDVIARQACLSKYHFCRLFKRAVGMSPKRYCVYRRIEYARQVLGRPGQNVTMTAFRSGFNDVTEFIRQFKKIAGVTPGSYRASRLGAHP